MSTDTQNALKTARQHFIAADNSQPYIRFGIAHVETLLRNAAQDKGWWKLQINKSNERRDIVLLALGILYMQNEDEDMAFVTWSMAGDRIANFFALQGDRWLSSDPLRATRFYDLAEQLSPEKVELLLRSSLAALYLNQRDVAEGKIGKILKKITVQEFIQQARYLYAIVDKGFIWTILTAAEIYQKEDKFSSAKKVLLAANEIHPGPVSLSPLGEFYCKYGEYERGIETLQKAKLYSDQFYALRSRQTLSLCYCRLGMSEEAFREAEELAQMVSAESIFRSWPSTLAQNWEQLCSENE
ncbi:MAG: hypothetical protein QXZ70_03905 [Candidatus Bathyarchaeia archaeon]